MSFQFVDDVRTDQASVTVTSTGLPTVQDSIAEDHAHILPDMALL